MRARDGLAAEKGEAVQADKSDCLIDITVDAYIPEKYIPDAAGRIEAYTRIAAIDDRPGADDVLDELADLAQVSPQLLRPMLQTVGLALVTKLASALCKDAGEGSLAAFVEVAGSAAAVLVALPLLRMVLQLMLGLL